MSTSKTCRTCGVNLVIGGNWTEGLVRKNSYLCRSCNSLRAKAYHSANRDRALEAKRRRLQNAEKAKADAVCKSKYYAENKEKWAKYRETQKKKEQSSPWHRAGRMLVWVRARAGKTSRDFDLTIEWVAERLERGVCEATGIPLILASDSSRAIPPWSPSIDRKDSSRGYTMDNCQVVCWAYNMAKSEWSDDVVLTMARALVAKN